MNIKTILTRLKNAHAILKASVHFREADSFMFEKKYREAEIAFEKGETIAPFLFIEKKILKGVIKYFCKDYDRSIAVFKEAWNDVDLIKRFSEDEKVYLKKYIYDFVITGKFGETGKTFYAVDFDKIKLEKIGKRLKRKCPMRDHPDWKQYGTGDRG